MGGKPNQDPTPRPIPLEAQIDGLKFNDLQINPKEPVNSPGNVAIAARRERAEETVATLLQNGVTGRNLINDLPPELITNVGSHSEIFPQILANDEAKKTISMMRGIWSNLNQHDLSTPEGRRSAILACPPPWLSSLGNRAITTQEEDNTAKKRRNGWDNLINQLNRGELATVAKQIAIIPKEWHPFILARFPNLKAEDLIPKQSPLADEIANLPAQKALETVAAAPVELTDANPTPPTTIQEAGPLKEILQPDRFNFFANVFARNMSEGKNRTERDKIIDIAPRDSQTPKSRIDTMVDSALSTERIYYKTLDLDPSDKNYAIIKLPFAELRIPVNFFNKDQQQVFNDDSTRGEHLKTMIQSIKANLKLPDGESSLDGWEIVLRANAHYINIMNADVKSTLDTIPDFADGYFEQDHSFKLPKEGPDTEDIPMGIERQVQGSMSKEGDIMSATFDARTGLAFMETMGTIMRSFGPGAHYRPNSGPMSEQLKLERPKEILDTMKAVYKK